jgi:hypothetical protein
MRSQTGVWEREKPHNRGVREGGSQNQRFLAYAWVVWPTPVQRLNAVRLGLVGWCRRLGTAWAAAEEDGIERKSAWADQEQGQTDDEVG